MAIVKESSNIVIINSRKFNGKIHRSWNARLIEQRSSLLILVGEFEEEVSHSFLGVIGRGTLSYEFYWLDRWYNVFRFHEPDGSLRNFYCNVNMPPQFENGTLDYIDLDIDILVWKDFSHQILDVEEFEENAKCFSYSEELREQVWASLSELSSLIENRTFPFDYKF